MEIKIEGNTLTITCPIGSGVPSKSGKTEIVATTKGFVEVGDENNNRTAGLKVSLNVIRPRRS